MCPFSTARLSCSALTASIGLPGGLPYVMSAAHELQVHLGWVVAAYDLGEGHPLLGRRMPDLDLVAANWVGNGKAFDRDDNALHVFWANGERELAHAPKAQLARELAGLIAERYLARHAQAAQR